MSVQEINLLSKLKQYKNPIKPSRIKPKILIRHKKIIEQVLKLNAAHNKINQQTGIQLELFSKDLN